MSSPSLDIPLEDLTQDRLHQWWALPTDRQRFVWALQTETRVRAHKVLQRDITPTLQSKLLFDIYLPAPDDLGQYDPRIPKRHVSLYRRKVNTAVFGYHTHTREPDAEFDTTAHRLDMKHPSPKYDDAPLAPPNMLFFDLLLEAYCGYSMQGHFHPADPSMPRAAIMGGAIVAVLVSWRDPKVAEMKEWEELEQWLQSPPDSHQDDSYEAIVERLQNQLQDYFYEGSSNYVARKPPMRLQFSPVCDYALRRKPYEQFYIARSDFVPGRFPGYYFKKSSAFVAGDVDIFLQPSPLTRSLACHLAEHGVEEDILKYVSEFIGGFEFCEGDLERTSTELCDEYIVPTFEDIGPLVYSATQRGLSFALSYESDDPFPNEWLQGKRWPRNTQLIVLSERADLLGGLFDFVADSCEYG